MLRAGGVTSFFSFFFSFFFFGKLMSRIVNIMSLLGVGSEYKEESISRARIVHGVVFLALS